MTDGGTNPRAASPRPGGVTALSLFFAFGVIACVLASALLLFPGSGLDAIWKINPRGHEGFLRMGSWALPLLLAVAVACSFAAVGLWRNAEWGHRLALGLLGANLVGDCVNGLSGDPRSLIGIPIALALMAYVWRRLSVASRRA